MITKEWKDQYHKRLAYRGVPYEIAVTMCEAALGNYTMMDDPTDAADTDLVYWNWDEPEGIP